MLFFLLATVTIAGLWAYHREYIAPEDHGRPAVSKAERRDFSAMLMRAAMAPANRTDLAITLGALCAAVLVTAFFGGVLATVLMGVVAVTCLAPMLFLHLTGRRTVKGLLRESRVTDDEELYIPADW